MYNLNIKLPLHLERAQNKIKTSNAKMEGQNISNTQQEECGIPLPSTLTHSI